MTHLLSKAHHLPAYREAFRDATLAFWETYWKIVSSWRSDVD